MSQAYIACSPDEPDALLEVHEAFRKAGIPDWHRPSSPIEAHDGDALARMEDAFALIVLVSGKSQSDSTVRADIERALARGLPIIPYRLDKARLNGFFRSTIAAHLRTHAGDGGALGELVTAVQAEYRRRCPVLAVMNLKGGIGKTTVSAQVSAAWQASTGGRVLLIDLDPQYNLTQVFFDMATADASAARDRSVISLFERSRLHASDAPSPAADWSHLSRAPFSPAPRARIVHELLAPTGPAGRLDLISGQFELSKYAFATSLDALNAIRKNFRAAIEALRSHYDLIVMDTNPNATFLTRCCLEASDRVIAPMHADVYSLRGVRLLNQVMAEHVAAEARPDLSVLFNAVRRHEQSTFEADARTGALDVAAGFALSQALLTAALPDSGHFAVKPPDTETPPWRQLLVHHGRGGGLKFVREALDGVVQEISGTLSRTGQPDR